MCAYKGAVHKGRARAAWLRRGAVAGVAAAMISSIGGVLLALALEIVGVDAGATMGRLFSFRAPPPAAGCAAKLISLCPPKEDSSCTTCTAAHASELTKAGCQAAEESAYCALAKMSGRRKVGEACEVALTAAFQPLLKDPTGDRAAEAVASWGMHLGDVGHFYQCQGTPGFNYWTVWFQSPPGNHSGQLAHSSQHHHHGDGDDDDHGMKKIGLCFPSKCDADDTALLAAQLLAVFEPVELLLPGSLGGHLKPVYATHLGEAPGLDFGATATLLLLIALALVTAVATARNSTCHSGCALAMPLAENVEKRFAKLLEAAEGDGFESDIIALAGPSPLKIWRNSPPPLLDAWQMVRQWEADGSPIPVDLPDLLRSAKQHNIPRRRSSDGSTMAELGLDVPLISSPVDTDSSLNSGGSGGSRPHSRTPKACAVASPVLDCWDAASTLETLLKPDTREVPEMRVLNGIRALSMAWIVLGHTFQTMEFTLTSQNNELFAALNVRPRLSAQLVIGGQLGVDTFFLLSGFLASYIGLKKLKNDGGCSSSGHAATASTDDAGSGNPNLGG
eukprot:COSAG05_NODE_3638_length_1939_cov_7.910206_1_plen_561_part_01